MCIEESDLGMLFETYAGAGYLVQLEYGHAGLAMIEPGICECCRTPRRYPLRYFSPGQLRPVPLGLSGWTAPPPVAAIAPHLLGGRS